MKKIVQINSVCNGSTGKIMCEISKQASELGYQSYCFFGRGKPNKNVNCIKFEKRITVILHALIARLGFNGHGSYFATKRLIKKLKKINPDVIHLHNIHGYYINLKVLFNYIKKEYKGKTVWTLHDCWTFTGHCPHFTTIQCDKWKIQCDKCPNLKRYPKQIFDTTKQQYKLKKELFTNVKNLTLITPSNWLMNLVKESYLKQYDVRVINNGIDLEIFKPTYDKKIYEKYSIPKNKRIILGVANVWEENKGLNIFLELSKRIKDDEIIILVGLKDKQIKELPNNIIGIKRTDNQKELACLYTIANILVNPSLEETFSLVTIEALSCGTHVLACNSTALKEFKNDGVVLINKYDIEEFASKIEEIYHMEKLNTNNITKYSKSDMINKYIKLY